MKVNRARAVAFFAAVIFRRVRTAGGVGRVAWNEGRVGASGFSVSASVRQLVGGGGKGDDVVGRKRRCGLVVGRGA